MRTLEVWTGCYPCYFLVLKKGRGLRPILDLSPQNFFFKKDKFKMLTLAQVRSALDPGDWLVVLICRTPISTCRSNRCYLRFLIETTCRLLTLEYSPGFRLDLENLEQHLCMLVGGADGSSSMSSAANVTCTVHM